MRSIGSHTVRRETNQDDGEGRSSLTQGVLRWLNIPIPSFLKAQPRKSEGSSFAIEMERERVALLCRQHTVFRLSGDPVGTYPHVVALKYGPKTVAILKKQYGDRLAAIANEDRQSSVQDWVIERDTSYLVRLSRTGEYITRVDQHLTGRPSVSRGRSSAAPVNQSTASNFARSEASRETGLNESNIEVEAYQNQQRVVTTQIRGNGRRRARR